MKKTFRTFLTNNNSSFQKLALSVAVVLGLMMSSFTASAQNWLPVDQAQAALKTQYYIYEEQLKNQQPGSAGYIATEARMEMIEDAIDTLGKGTPVSSVPTVLFDESSFRTKMAKYLAQRQLIATFRAELVDLLSN